MHAELDTAALSMQVAKLAALLDVVQQRIETIVTPPRQEEAAPPPVAAESPPAAEPVASEEALAAPEAAPEPAEAPPEADADPRPTAVPEVGWFESGSALAAVAAAALAAEQAEKPSGTVYKAGTIPPPSPFAGEDFSSAGPSMNARRKAEALAPILALTEEERLALFT
jgi:hypothetical protein